MARNKGPLLELAEQKVNTNNGVKRPRYQGDKAGRPSKYTPEISDEICRYVKHGTPLHIAARKAGVGKETVYGWKSLFPAFSDALDAAQAEFVLANVLHISNKAPKLWQAAAWLLERRCREDFGKQAVEISGVNGGPIELNAAVEHRALARVLREDPAAQAAHGALLERLGVRGALPGRVRVGNDEAGERAVASGEVPRPNKRRAPKRRSGKNKKTRH